MKKDVFPRTLNTWIDQKLAEGEAGRADLNQYIMKVYADPLRVYCLGTPGRHLGEPDELVEDFFADRLARDDYFKGWKESGLRLRRWLMNGFGFYLKELRREKRKEGRERPIDEDLDAGSEDTSKNVEVEMDRAFAVSIVREALREAKRLCESKGLKSHWEIFHRHYYEGSSYADFVKEYGVDAVKAADMARTAAGKFRSALRDLLSSDGALESEIDAEIGTLLEICA